MPVVYCEMVCYGIVQSIMFLCLGAILWKLALPYNVVIVLARWEICHRDARFWFWLILLLIHLLHNGINCWTAMHRDTRIYIAKSCLLGRHRVELKQLMCMSGAVSTSCALVIVPCHSLKLRLVVWRAKAQKVPESRWWRWTPSEREFKQCFCWCSSTVSQQKLENDDVRLMAIFQDNLGKRVP